MFALTGSHVNKNEKYFIKDPFFFSKIKNMAQGKKEPKFERNPWNRYVTAVTDGRRTDDGRISIT